MCLYPNYTRHEFYDCYTKGEFCRKKIQHQFKEFGVASLTHKSWQITYEVIINYSLGKL